MKTGVKIALVTVPLLGIGAYMLLRKPTALVRINQDGSGSATLGSKTENFGVNEGVSISHLGWKLNADKSNQTLSHFGKLSSGIKINRIGNKSVLPDKKDTPKDKSSDYEYAIADGGDYSES
jgi:hypothetical protein